MKQSNGGVSRKHSKSYLEKIIFSVLHCSIIFIGIWLVFFNGFGFNLIDKNRAILLLGFAILYFIRHLITLFHLFVRKIEFREIFGLSIFFIIFEIGAILIGGGIFKNTIIEFGNIDIFAILLLFIGSFLNTFSELQRKWWKNDINNNGHCYTDGLFKYSMHINYFGDIVLFTGWMLFTHCYLMLILPIFMFLAFTFFHIPNLDKYLLIRYGKEFENYSRRTKKLIPFIY